MPTTPLTPSEREAQLELVMGFMQTTISNIELIILVIRQLIAGTFTVVTTSSFTCQDFFTRTMEFITLLVRVNS